MKSDISEMMLIFCFAYSCFYQYISHKSKTVLQNSEMKLRLSSVHCTAKSNAKFLVNKMTYSLQKPLKLAG